MKTFQNYLLGAAMICLFSVTLKAQLPNIESLTIVPVNPTTEDMVQVSCQSVFSSGGCPLTFSNVSVNATTIDVFATHDLGPMAYICTSTNVITIGQLACGYYNLRYHLSCSPCPSGSDIDSVYFMVTSITGEAEIEKDSPEISIYPNPVFNEFSLPGLSLHMPATIIMYDLYGNQLKRISSERNQTTTDVSMLVPGIYFVEVRSGKETYRGKFIKP